MKKIILLDRDGVINKKAPEGQYVTRWDRFCWLKDNINGLCQLAERGYQFIVITNQACINKGLVEARVVDQIHHRMQATLKAWGVSILSTYVCPHRPDEDCTCRKPRAGQLIRVGQAFSLRLDQTFYVGDDPRDCVAAYNAKVKSIYVGNQQALCSLKPDQMPWATAGSIDQLVEKIDDQFLAWRDDQLKVIEERAHSILTDG